MDELFKGLFTAPLATLFIMSGMIFLLIAVIGNISGKVEPGSKARIASGIFGLAFILVGVSMHVMQNKPNPPASPTVSPTPIKPDQPVPMPQTLALTPSTETSNNLQNIKESKPAPQAKEPVQKPETIVVSTFTNEKLPDWVPIYPVDKIDLSIRDGSAQGQSGSFSFSTQDSIYDVLNFYEARFTVAGLEMSRNNLYYYIIGKSASNGRTITVNVSSYTKDKKELTKALVSFEEIKP
jgi:hypothetical protein